MKPITVDSSVYLSSLIPSDVFHTPSKNFLKKVQKKKVDVFLPILIPLEITNVLHREQIPPDKVVQVFESFYATPRTRILALDWAIASAFLKNIGQFSLKTADWLIASTCHYLNTTLITWDKQLLDKTKLLLGTQTPTQWMQS